MRRFVALVLALALGAVACGGTNDEKRPDVGLCRPIPDFVAEFGPDDGGHPPDCNALDGYELYFINRFEVLHQSDWYFNNDRSALQYPPADTQGAPTTFIPGGRCIGAEPTARAATVCERPEIAPGECTGTYVPDSWSAMRVTTGKLANGGVMGSTRPKVSCIEPLPDEPETQCPFQPGPPEIGPCGQSQTPSQPELGCHAAQDTSTWEGIVFWGRVGPGSESSVRVRTSDGFTDDKGCYCNPYTSENDASDGCDKFGMFVELDLDYRVVFAPFDQMQQGGWGLPRDHLDTSNIFEIAVDFTPGVWDLWVDDVAYYRRRP